MEKIAPDVVGEEVAEALERLDATTPSVSGKQTAIAAAKLLVEKDSSYVVPSGSQRQNLLVAFAKTGAVVYGKAFDIVRLLEPVNLDSEPEISANLKAVVLYEIKSTNRKVGPDFQGYFFSLSTAELLVAQSLKSQFRFAFVNTSTGEVQDLSLTDVFARAKGIYPTWSIRF